MALNDALEERRIILPKKFNFIQELTVHGDKMKVGPPIPSSCITQTGPNHGLKLSQQTFIKSITVKPLEKVS